MVDVDDADQAAGANSVLGKARLILEAFQLDDDSLTLTEMARRTGISKASVHRPAAWFFGTGRRPFRCCAAGFARRARSGCGG